MSPRVALGELTVNYASARMAKRGSDQREHIVTPPNTLRPSNPQKLRAVLLYWGCYATERTAHAHLRLCSS